ncbi:FeoB-associated Cys-rich membrane protein [Paracidovorax valerianellae]|uniref:Uncharacterized protein n=1 Tax=Paracidovorax valerianellae TaxID=187868 RepID=A0A1G6VPF8_9BURK|nr:FeoB-associated Cys-rich membrane protein [Paracidovorax valerianellae]MDA8447053.1 FeoB-associated Cys-rich membrane protein [Paracidovorax valerianellae]SDD55482.1 hypothetical protein SAMN05192589_107102 [Paracidovorax valerianellae]
MAQEIIVGVIVVLAAAYVVWKWMPARWRSRLGRVHPTLAQSTGCGGCSSCDSGGCGTGGGAVGQEQVVQMPGSRSSVSK